MRKQQPTGKRTQPRMTLREQYARQPYQRGRREEQPTPKPRRGLAQMVVSAVLLAVIVGVKLAAPDVAERYRDDLLHLMGNDTDFVAAFSAVGRAVGSEKLGDALNDAYVAVFGPSDEEAAPVMAVATDTVLGAVYTPENTPSRAELFQQVLGFAYTDPVAGTLSDGFGYRQHPMTQTQRFHYGMDIAADSGTVIGAFADGVVTAVGDSSDLGKYVELAHANGYSTLYAHCSRITASSGQSVRMGEPIAEVGQTGEATGPHLHFELHRDTLYLNPIYYVTL